MRARGQTDPLAGSRDAVAALRVEPPAAAVRHGADRASASPARRRRPVAVRAGLGVAPAARVRRVPGASS